MIKRLKKRKRQLIIYTDGSRLEDGNTGAGAAFYPRICQNIATNTGPEHEVYDSELVAATTALNHARTPTSHPTKTSFRNISTTTHPIVSPSLAIDSTPQKTPPSTLPGSYNLW